MGGGSIERVASCRRPKFRLIPFESRHFGQLRSWVRNEREALEWGGERVSFPLTDAQFEGMLADGERSLRASWMLDKDGEAVAHAQAVLDWRGNSARLARIIVDPARRGEGLGKVLLEEVTRALFGLGFERLTLNVYLHNRRARELYQSFGFEPCALKDHAVAFGDEQWHVLEMALTAANANGVTTAP